MWGNPFKRFRTWVLGTTALTVGAAAFITLPAAPANAAAPCVVGPGGDTIDTATSVGSDCTLTQIFSFQGAPAYWEFSWDQVPNPLKITATEIGTGSFGGGSFLGSLELYAADDHALVASSTFGPLDSGGVPGGSFFGQIATLDNVVLAPEDYIIGVLPREPDPDAFTTAAVTPPTMITLDFAPATVPEPAAVGFLGGALAAFGLLRRRWKKR